jgi:uncharacterized protein
VIANRTPEQTFRALLAGVSAGAGSVLAELYAPDARVEHPLDPDGAPPLQGREALRAHFVGGEELSLHLRPADIVVHNTTDPEVIVGEFVYELLDEADRIQQRLPCVFIMRVRDGLIVESRDYAPPPPA